MSVTRGRSTIRDQCMKTPCDGSSRWAIMSNQPWPAMRSRTCTMRIASSVLEKRACLPDGGNARPRNCEPNPEAAIARGTGNFADSAGFARVLRCPGASAVVTVTLSSPLQHP